MNSIKCFIYQKFYIFGRLRDYKTIIEFFYSNNKNWIQRYNLGYTLDNSFNESVALNDFGITENGNTTYSVSLSTDAKFSKNNRFYPSRLY